MTGGSEVKTADDLIQPFQIEASAIRGRLVRLGPALDEILTRHDYPAVVASVLGEAMALAALLSTALKYEGIFTLQTKGNGPLSLLVADITSTGDLRGYAQFGPEATAALLSQAGRTPLCRAFLAPAISLLRSIRALTLSVTRASSS